MNNLLILGVFLSAFTISNSITPEFCKLPVNEGEGNEFLFAFHYDHVNDKCNPFFYKGQGGNGNRFANDKECLRNCSDKADEFYPRDVAKACRLKHDKGGCNGHIWKFYYDPVHDKCKIFFWTGCFGNGNRFNDYETCNATCAGVHVEGEDPEEDESDTPIAIICGVLLGVILVAVLITVIVLTVKSKKKSAKKEPQRKSNDPKSESPLQERGIEMA